MNGVEPRHEEHEEEAGQHEQDPGDQALLHRILAKADIWIQNLAPGATERAGLGSEALRQRYPRLITVDISGYGEVGPPYDRMKAYDLLVQAESGIASVTGWSARPSSAARSWASHSPASAANRS